MRNRAIGICLLLLGAAATRYVWSSARTGGVYDLNFAVFGPLLVGVGLGYLIHGGTLPRRRITRLTKAYAILGGLAAILNLHFLNAGRDMFVTIMEVVLGLALTAMWFLPAQMLEDPRQQASRPKLPSDPIEPAASLPFVFHTNWPTVKKYPVLGLLLGLAAVFTVWLMLQSGMDEARALITQKSPTLFSVREATHFYGIRWITLSNGTWHCADAVRIKRDDPIPRLIFGSIAGTEVPITGEDGDVVVAVFDGDVDCSRSPARLSGVIGSVEIFGDSKTRSRWQTAGRRVTVLNVDASPSTAVWLFSLIACVLVGGVVFAGYFVRLTVLKYADPER